MPLPSSRDLTATAASGVPANLHNVMQDCIIGAKHGDLWVPLNIAAGHGGGTVAESSVQLTNPGVNPWWRELPFAVGTRIKAFRFVARSAAGTEDVTLNLRAQTFAGAVFSGASNVQSLALVNIPVIAGSTWTQYLWTLAPAHSVIDNQFLTLEWTQTSGTNTWFAQLYAQIDRP